MDRVYIVGAGPAGLTTSFFLINKNVPISITVFDHRKEPGIPPHCTSIVGEETAQLYSRIIGGKVIEKKYYSIVFHTPLQKYVVYSKKPLAYRLARPYLEQRLYDQVMRMGVDVRMGEHVKPAEEIGVVVVNGREYRGLIVAADGAYSVFRRKYCGWTPSVITGVQRIIRVNERLDDTEFHVFFDPDTPCFYQWIVPVDGDNTVLVGYGDCRITPDPSRMIERILGKIGLKPVSGSEFFGGPIIRDLPREPYSLGNKIFFIGDSLPASKPVTGGGLYGVAVLAPVLAESIAMDMPGKYVGAINELKKRFRTTWFLARLFRKKYWVLADMFSALRGELETSLFDMHEKIVWKALPRLPLVMYLLVRSLLIRTRRSRV